MPYLILTCWLLGVTCVVRGASLWSPALAWTVTGSALLAMMAWFLAQTRTR